MVSELVYKCQMLCLKGTKCGTDIQTDIPTMVNLIAPDAQRQGNKDEANTQTKSTIYKEKV